MRYVLLAVALLFASPVFAQQQPNTSDQYWQQLIAGEKAQSSQQIVNMARQLDEVRQQVTTLQKELAELKAKKEEKK